MREVVNEGEREKVEFVREEMGENRPEQVSGRKHTCPKELEPREGRI